MAKVDSYADLPVWGREDLRQLLRTPFIAYANGESNLRAEGHLGWNRPKDWPMIVIEGDEVNFFSSREYVGLEKGRAYHLHSNDVLEYEGSMHRLDLV